MKQLIKNIKEQFFIRKNKRISELKRQAKSLNKISPHVTVQQCRDIIAQNNGFSDWDNFIAYIKTQFSQKKSFSKRFLLSEEGEISFAIQQKLNTSNQNHSLLFQAINQNYFPILMGYDINLNHYMWHKSQQFAHTTILGDNIYSQYDVFLAKQAIANYQGVIFCNGAGDSDTVEELIKVAQKHNREKDIKIFNFTDNILSTKYNVEIEDNFLFNHNTLIESLKYFDNCLNNDFDKNHALYILNNIIHYLKEEEILLSINNIKKHLNLDFLHRIAQQRNYIKSANIIHLLLESFYKNYNEHTKDNDFNSIFHYLVSDIIFALDSLGNSGIFVEESSNSLSQIFNREQNIIIIQFSPTTKKSNKFLQLFIDRAIQEILILNQQGYAKIRKFIFYRNYYFLNSNLNNLIFSVARGRAISINFSYKNQKEVFLYMKKEFWEYILGNTSIKIWGSSEPHISQHLSKMVDYKLQPYSLHESQSKNQFWLFTYNSASQLIFSV